MLALLAVVAFSLATRLELRVGKWTDATRPVGAFTKLLGEGRRMFANQFITMADVYLHSGYYPSIFDQQDAKAAKAIAGDGSDPEDHDQHGHEGGQHDENCKHDHEDEHEKAMSFRGEPRNWLDAFIRRFRITEHTHLENGEEREVLPWLRIAIELDPQKIETYTATAYWLRQMDRAKDAAQVLREGIRNNPNNAELLFEMGVIQYDDHHDAARARGMWTLALRRWEEQSDEIKKDSTHILDRIAVNLGRLEESAGNLGQAIAYYEMAAKVSPNPASLQKRIDEAKARLVPPLNSPLKPAL